MFTSVLVANRGEIAVRICRTLREMGVRSVVVASIPDRASLAVRSAAASVLLEGYSATDTYLDAEAVIAAAKAQGCQAIHPGYGFLSERADFAERCAAEGIVFIGPPPRVLRALGDKSSARRLAVSNGVPVVPGYDGPDDDQTLIERAAALGLPLMVKARGGGGGRGMREVHDIADLPAAIESARREALASFGDGGLLLERLVTNAHHVEVQVLADAHGHLLHLGERDCSVQRRRQKLIEETPSPVVDEVLRARLTAAALTIVRATGYVNAGTVEFLVGEPDARAERPFYFLEVNPRLQVEHPVTEMVTGLDLVELQLRVAAGEPLPFTQEDVTFSGHAIELRVNAEDPWDGFRPSSGRISRSRLGEAGAGPGSASRADLGYEGGDTVPGHYDSLVAKLVSHAADRAGALDLASRWPIDGLLGIRSNLGLLRAVVTSPDFASGRHHISWLEPRLAELEASAETPASLWLVAAVAASPRGAAWMGAGAAPVWLDDGQRTRCVQVRWDGERHGRVGSGESMVPFRLRAPGAENARVQLSVGEWTGALPVVERDATERARAVPVHGATLRLVAPPPLPRRASVATAGAMTIVAPLPGTITGLPVSVGDVVEPGQLLCLLEAMKMEHRVTATAAGTVSRIAVAVGAVVREGDLLVELA